ncbi:MAG: DUF4830 domain-containing protein [Oscillospiraceae bacterium]
MMVMTAKVNLKKTLLALTAVAAVILSLILLLGGKDTAQTGAPAPSANDGRVKFLQDFGWDVTTSPKESGRVRIPEQSSEAFDRYNTLQKGQGYDLGKYAGKTVMRYVYQINNYPGAKEPVYATVLVYKNQIIGGDVTDTSAKGHIRGFKMPEATTPTESTVPIQ